MSLELSVLGGAVVACWESTCEAAYIAKNLSIYSGFKCVGCPSLAPPVPSPAASFAPAAVWPCIAGWLCRCCEPRTALLWAGAGNGAGVEQEKRTGDRLFSSVSDPGWVWLAGKRRKGMKWWGMEIGSSQCAALTLSGKTMVWEYISQL